MWKCEFERALKKTCSNNLNNKILFYWNLLFWLPGILLYGIQWIWNNVGNFGLGQFYGIKKKRTKRYMNITLRINDVNDCHFVMHGKDMHRICEYAVCYSVYSWLALSVTEKWNLETTCNVVLRQHLALCKFIFECKIDLGGNILRKRKTCSTVWLCCENYAGKLFFVFGLTYKKPISKKGKHKSTPNHRHHQGKAQPTTNHPKYRSRRGKNPPPLLFYHQNTTTHTTTMSITTKSEIKEKEYQT